MLKIDKIAFIKGLLACTCLFTFQALFAGHELDMYLRNNFGAPLTIKFQSIYNMKSSAPKTVTLANGAAGFYWGKLDDLGDSSSEFYHSSVYYTFYSGSKKVGSMDYYNPPSAPDPAFFNFYIGGSKQMHFEVGYEDYNTCDLTFFPKKVNFYCNFK